VIQCPRFILSLFFAFIIAIPITLALSSSFAAAQADAQTSGQGQRDSERDKDKAPDKPPHIQHAQVAGNWQVSWQGRLGTEQGTLTLHQDGTELAGTFKDFRGVMPLSGTVAEKKLSFEVRFSGSRPFTTRFTGTADGDKLEGTSEAVGVGAFLGHAGEIVHPEHPWTAKRVADEPSKSDQTSSNSNAPASNYW
jgi:hypothetical protein